MPKAKYKTIRTNKHELHQAAHWLSSEYTPSKMGTIATGPRDPNLIVKDKQFAKELGKQLLKKSKRKRQGEFLSIALHEELINWFAELASVNLFQMQCQLREKNRKFGRRVPDFAFVCLPYSHLHSGRPRLSKEAVRKKIDQRIHGDRWLKRLRARESKFNELFIPYPQDIIKKTP